MSEILTALFILIGAFFVLVGSFGMLRFPTFFTRLHGPTKATTLGLASLAAAFVAFDAGTGAGFSVREFLVILFLFITAPVSAFVLARAALRRRVHSMATPPDAVDDQEPPS